MTNISELIAAVGVLVERTNVGLETLESSAAEAASALTQISALIATSPTAAALGARIENGTIPVGFQPLGAGAVLQTMSSELSRLAVSPLRYGATDDPATHAAAMIFANTWATIRGLPLNLEGMRWDPQTPVTLTNPIVDTYAVIFTLAAAAKVTIATGHVRPDWFGDVPASIEAAIQMLPATGGLVLLRAKRYKPNGHVYGVVPKCLAKKGVRVHGAGVPRYNADCTALEDGSVIEDMFLVYAHSIELFDLGVDSGSGVCDTYFAGAAREGLVCTYPSQAIKDASELRTGLRLHNIRALCKDSTSLVHSMIVAEGYSDVFVTGIIEGCYGTHGVVIKASYIRADTLSSYLNAGEGVIIKSDAQETSKSYDIQINRIFTYRDGPRGTVPHVACPNAGMGTMFNPSANNMGKIQIGSIYDDGHPVGVGTNFAGPYTLEALSIDAILTDHNSIASTEFSVYNGGFLKGIQFTSINGRNTPNVLVTNSGTLQVGKLYGVSVGAVLDCFGTAGPIIASVTGEACAAGLMRLRGDIKPKIKSATRITGANKMYATDMGGTVPAIGAAWAQVEGNDLFEVTLDGEYVDLTGLLRPDGSGGTTALVVNAWAKPEKSRRISFQGINLDGSVHEVLATVDSDTGNVVLNEYGGVAGTANCNQYLSLAGGRYKL